MRAIASRAHDGGHYVSIVRLMARSCLPDLAACAFKQTPFGGLNARGASPPLEHCLVPWDRHAGMTCASHRWPDVLRSLSLSRRPRSCLRTPYLLVPDPFPNQLRALSRLKLTPKTNL